jgi:hypothetical protein
LEEQPEQYYRSFPPKTPEMVHGWAKFEPFTSYSIEIELKFVLGSYPFHAHTLSTRKNTIGISDYLPDIFSSNIVADEVLFLEPKGNVACRRIGVRLIYYRNMMSEFRHTESIEIQLE